MNTHRQLLILTVVIGAMNAYAHVIRVPENAPTIQAGLDSLQDTDTVLVSLGTYAEALVAPPLRFVLRGDVVPDTGDYPRPLIDISLLPGSDSLTSLVLPEHSSPVIEDLAFRNGPEMYPNYTDGGIRSRADNLVLRRVAMDSVIDAVSHFNLDTTSTVSLEDCRFRHVCFSGVDASWNAVIAHRCLFVQNQGIMISCGDHSLVTDCQFEAEQSPADYMLMVQGKDVRVMHCVFSSSQPIVSNAVRVQYGGIGVSVPVKFEDNTFSALMGSASPVLVYYNLGHYASTVIDNNVFIGNQVTPQALSGGIEFDKSYGFDAGVLASVKNNLFVQCSGPSSGGNAIRLCAGTELDDNRFFDLSPQTIPAIRYARDSLYNSPVLLQRNLFYETGQALANDDDVLIDAEWNWWGDETGPFHAELNPSGQGDTIVGNVDFDPWHADTSFLSVPGIGKPLPETFVLEAYPNPFNSTVTFTLIPPDVMIVRVELFDILGRRVREIWSGPLAFQKYITFDGSDLTSGIYFARVWQPIGNRPLAMTKLVLIK